MNDDLQKKIDLITAAIKAQTDQFINQKVTPQVLSGIANTAKLVLEKSQVVDNMNDHIDVLVKQSEEDRRDIKIIFSPKDEIGRAFLKRMQDGHQ